MTLQEELSRCRSLAIALSEGPDGPHRRRAEALQRQLNSSRSQAGRSSSGSSWAAVIFSLLMLIASQSAGLIKRVPLERLALDSSRIAPRIVFHWLRQGFSSTAPANPQSAPRVSAPSTTVAPAPRRPQVAPDPAAAMQARVHASTWGGPFAGLDAGMDHYRRLSGTLARMQAVGLRKRAAAHRLPTVFINRTNDCFEGPSIGIYSPRCEVLKIDYGDGRLAYEHSVEIEVTLAHEWGHHMINISNEKMSPTEAEVVSDCMAGAVFGYYAKHELITRQEALRAIEMIAAVGNNSADGHHPNREVRLKAFAGGLMSIAAPNEPEMQGAIAFCSTLERLLSLRKLRAMGLTWPA